MDGITLIDTNPRVDITSLFTISKLAFINRLTTQEFVDIVSASKTDVEVEVWKIKFDVSTQFNLQDSKFKEDLNFLVSKNLLTEMRVHDILMAPVQDSERP